MCIHKISNKMWSRCVRSWAALGAYVGDPGPLLGLILAVLGRSWGLCGRSGAEKCEEHAYLGGGLGPLLGLMLVVLAALGAYVGGPWRP